ncbi:MAG TPA: ABC transporter substrate-binding protein [Lachnoclostridium sp.]|uniref:Peptide/nickel transport system substrate-binding protein n=1 Tax=[Clostridium] celerecrescens 18A TaxID=1286362 RepID=A0A2M8Z7J6_9FIRM|nr:ABC transporter substrate-binding protein [Lacrimispora celerecrescens]PJJ29428.1 peptide/nickel transport system substrate-binding protein [[Clostridium] celerecrescens 18A]HBE85671.1 ABC transporter substrate-binding protein [Lachnoclostridium sp.]
MKKNIKKLISLGLAVSMAAALSACGSSSGPSPTTSETTAAAGSDAAAENTGAKILRVAAVDPQVAYDMQQYTYSLIMKVTDNVVESLLTTLDGGKVVPTLLAKEPELSDDMLTYSFELTGGVKFHNGETLKSSDVKYSLERVVKKQSMGSLLEKVEGYEALADGSANELTGIKVIDDTHFTITLSEVYTPFVSVLSTPYCGIYPAEACEAAGDNWGKTELIGTGPFKFDSYTPGVGVEISRFDGYYGNAPKLDGVSYKFIEDANTQVLEYQKGNIDYVDVETNMYPVYQADPKLKDQMHMFQPIGGYYMTFNVKSISDPKIRQAISMSINRQAICESIFHGTAKPASSFIPAGIIGHDDSQEEFAYDPEGAKALLAEAGYANGYDLRLTVNTKYATSIPIATAFQEQAKAAGINVTIEQVDSAAWSDMKKSGGVDAGVGNWYVDYNDPDSMLYPVSDSRTDRSSSFWHNEEFKKLMEAGVQTSDEAERQEIYVKAEHILSREDYAIAPIYNESKCYLLNPKITGLVMDSTFRNFYANADIQQ